MKQINSTLIILILLIATISCAKQSSPTGGPRDNKPPVLTGSEPLNLSLDTKPKDIQLVFDEFIALENASKNIIITPRIDKDKIEFSALKNTVNIKLNQDLEDSTTYVFNFQKAVVDISEKNPAENLKLVFSTGSALDSLTISGKINFYFSKTGEDYKDVLVGLYPIGDTTDLFKAQPYYIGQIDTTGNFKITNIKNGNYKAFAWRDLNGNVKAEYKTEEYDFLVDTIQLTSNMENVQFNLSKSDITPIKILRSSTFGKNYDIIVNRDPVKTTIQNKELGSEYFYTNTTDKKIRIYPRSIKQDSIAFQINIQDSVGFEKDTTLYAKFKESERKPEKLEIIPNSGKNFYKDLNIELRFNKPITDINLDSLFITYDSASRIRIDGEMMNFQDSAKLDVLEIKLSLPDSIEEEIITLVAGDSTFFDIEKQTNDKVLKANYRKLKKEELADEIKGRIEKASPPFIVQLLNSKDEIVSELFIEKENTYSFKNVEPGTFKLRVIEDRNGNQRWDPGNYIFNRLAERIFYFKGEENKTEITVRSGWTLEDQNITASPSTGFKKED